MIRVLIVEDDPMVLEVNKGYLSKLDNFHLVASVSTASEAIEIVKNEKVDLVLLDIYLPEMSGIDLLKQLRRLNIPLDVITITAARDSETVHKMFRLGVIDYLVKPFHFERFKMALNNYERFWFKLQNKQLVNQGDIDGMMKRNEMTDNHVLPKGLNEITLKQVMLTMLQQEEPIRAEQIAQHLGLARVTVRRYLDYLAKENKVKVELKYGRVGRPSHYYSI